jgi:hypothetical protein
VLGLFSRWGFVGGSAVVVAITADRVLFEFAVAMAVGAIHLGVDLIELQAGDGVTEILLIPAAVAVDTHPAQL